jgi:eukaryotic-like serine/threonine-protein kinase
MSSDLRTRLQNAVGQRFAIEEEVSPGTPAVFRAKDTVHGGHVHIKAILSREAPHHDIDVFLREKRLLSELQCRNVVTMLAWHLELWPTPNAMAVLYYVTPLLDGTLRDRIARDAPMQIDVVTGMLRTILAGLTVVHRNGRVHRNLTPENILIEGNRAVLSDFRTMALYERGAVGDDALAYGTPGYMAPELMVGDPDADHRADLYSVGAIAYEMLTGSRPFTGSPQQILEQQRMQPAPDIRRQRPDLPSSLAEVVMRALERKPSARQSEAIELLRHLAK